MFSVPVFLIFQENNIMPCEHYVQEKSLLSILFVFDNNTFLDRFLPSGLFFIRDGHLKVPRDLGRKDTFSSEDKV
jgi:hypothetical protein